MPPYNEKYYRHNHPYEYARKHWIDIIRNECEREFDIHRIVVDITDEDDKLELCVIGANNELIFRVVGLTYGEITIGLHELNYMAVTDDCWLKKN